MRVAFFFTSCLAWVLSDLQPRPLLTMGEGTSGVLTTCPCTYNESQLFSLPAEGGIAQPIVLLSNTSQCWQLNHTLALTTCVGLCAFLGPCASPQTPTWRRVNNSLRVASSPDPARPTGWCLDENRQGLYLQAYRTCIPGAPQQAFEADAAGRLQESWSGRGYCVTAPGPSACQGPPPPPPTPPPPPPLLRARHTQCTRDLPPPRWVARYHWNALARGDAPRVPGLPRRRRVAPRRQH